jgi:hypothetical protein
MRLRLFTVLLCLFLAPLLAAAGEVDVTKVKVRKTAPNVFSFDVTLRHADTGWKHYANKWQVVSPDGKVLGTRTLLHPHVDEQPFTRSLSGVRIPATLKTVTVKAFDTKHADGGAVMAVRVPH